MSCRVLHRGVEEKLLAKIAAEAEEQSLEQVGQLFGFFWSAAVLATEMDKNPGVHLENIAEQGNYRWFKDVQ